MPRCSANGARISRGSLSYGEEASSHGDGALPQSSTFQALLEPTEAAAASRRPASPRPSRTTPRRTRPKCRWRARRDSVHLLALRRSSSLPDAGNTRGLPLGGLHLRAHLSARRSRWEACARLHRGASASSALSPRRSWMPPHATWYARVRRAFCRSFRRAQLLRTGCSCRGVHCTRSTMTRRAPSPRCT